MANELKQILPGTLGREALWNFLEARVRANMADFYGSEAFTQALG